MLTLSLPALFSVSGSQPICHTGTAQRFRSSNEWGEKILDCFNEGSCLFIRINSPIQLLISVDAPISFNTCSSGGFISTPSGADNSRYWIPCEPKTRRINEHLQILSEQTTSPTGWSANTDEACLYFSLEAGEVLDFVVWQIPHDSSIAQQLTKQSTTEAEGHFLWGSHAHFTHAGGLYNQLVFGSAFDVRFSWPHSKKCHSENEAHALYTTFSGLERGVGKSIYRLLQEQLLLSLIDSQAEDGGFYHGIWTDETECHYRLHTSAVHLFLDECQRTGCDQVKQALGKAVQFLSKTTDQLDCGTWFLHDSLELSEEAMNSGPFSWIPNRTLGKSKSNMLVLNTHLDSTIALNRYGRLTGDLQYQPLVDSAIQSTRAVLNLQPANWLYKPLFWAIGLTMLPTGKASELSAPIRAIKRIAWQYLVKKLPDIKARFPRLVMPNGYIDRELSLRTWAIDYQTINLMDLARYARAFPGQFDETILDKAMAFTQTSGLIKRYRELQPGKRYAPGFWMEALYYRCLSKDDLKYRQWLAEAMLECHALGFGMAPSLLGANGEALNTAEPSAFMSLEIEGLLFANLNHQKSEEILLVNSTGQSLSLESLPESYTRLDWYGANGSLLSNMQIPAKSWIRGRSDDH